MVTQQGVSLIFVIILATSASISSGFVLRRYPLLCGASFRSVSRTAFLLQKARKKNNAIELGIDGTASFNVSGSSTDADVVASSVVEIGGDETEYSVNVDTTIIDTTTSRRDEWNTRNINELNARDDDDDDWVSHFQQLLNYKQTHGDCLVPAKFAENPQLRKWVSQQRSNYNKGKPNAISDERIRRLNDVGFKWNPIQAQWDRRFDELVKYRQTHGDCLVPHKFPENPQLGVWVNCQRYVKNCKTKSISDERIKRLNEIGFEWDPIQAQWEARFEELVEYKNRYGDCLVPTIFKKNPQLGSWVHQQRCNYNKNKQKAISDERIQRLNDVGFEWDAYQAQWDLRFDELVKYKETYGDCLVPNKFPDNLQLGFWVGRQRDFYHNCEIQRISDEHIQRLNEIGFEWDPLKTVWEIRFNELVEYKRQHGDCLVPKRFYENPTLGQWVTWQRVCYRKVRKELSDERIQRLEAIGFEWNPKGLQWEIMFQELVMYNKQYGDCLVPRPFPENPPLARWLVKQRTLYALDPKRITKQNIKRLEDLGFEWDDGKGQWEAWFQQLVAYQKEHGHCMVPGWTSLARYVAAQRAAYQSQPPTISGDRIKRLDNIGIVWHVDCKS